MEPAVDYLCSVCPESDASELRHGANVVHSLYAELSSCVQRSMAQSTDTDSLTLEVRCDALFHLCVAKREDENTERAKRSLYQTLMLMTKSIAVLRMQFTQFQIIC